MELPSRYEPQATETKWYPWWETHGFFHADETRDPKDSPPYCIVIPPPNITGILHMGHALNNTLQDVLIRWKRMAGYNALWVPGTDHASIATQVVVERALKKEGLSRESLGRERFLERVWQWKEKHGRIIVTQLKRLGCSCDWQRERFTMDPGLSQAVRTVFKRLYDEGLIYRGNYLVNWCPRCRTTLSDDEVEFSEKPGKLWYLRYPVEGEPGKFAVVATTRPETMLGDTAVAVNPTDERYRDWIGKHVILPLVGRRIPIIADDFVEKDFGTGMVKITPAHDFNDYLAGKRHGLPEINVLTPDAKINENAPAYAGLDRYEARKRILADLEAQGLIERIEDYTQRAGECYRCHTVIEPYVSLQWFVKMAPLAEPARAAVEEGRVRFIPKSRERDYFHWLDNLRDWCISRQLWWGHRIPAWSCLECGEIIVTDTEHLDTPCPKCGGRNLEQDPDVLDTWFSSALWPFSTLGWPERTRDLELFYPTDTLVTAKDIIFLWVARMIMMGLHFLGEVPFKDVYFNPIVGDEHGKKMSKSKGNAIDPLDLMDQYGTDALRITLCDYAAQEQHIAFSVKRCEGYRNFMNKIWNAARLVLANTADLTVEDLAQAVALDPRNDERVAIEDRWILHEYSNTVKTVGRALEEYRFDDAVHAIYDFLWKNFCDYYLELIKPRLYSKEATDKASRREAQTTAVVILEGLLRLLHPFCPFITEELWQALRARWGTGNPCGEVQSLGQITLGALNHQSIMVAPWNELAPQWHTRLENAAAKATVELLQEIVYAIRNVRGEMKVPPAMATDVSVVCGDEATRGILDHHLDFVRRLVNIGSLSVYAELQPTAFTATAVAGPAVVHVELPQEMREAEISRLEREVARVQQLIDNQKKKLASEAFVSKAPVAVVEKEKAKLAQLQTEYEQFAQKLAQFRNA
ncbi:MAG: valine--tRNA ligase [Candidatus Sumerlaeaceae bacterium]|nr:valine--tRNA ligase [Candidatus Sumerlaeaceae bacterium]